MVAGWRTASAKRMSLSSDIGIALFPSSAFAMSSQYWFGSVSLQPMKGFLGERPESCSLAGKRTRKSNAEWSVLNMVSLLI